MSTVFHNEYHQLCQLCFTINNHQLIVFISFINQLCFIMSIIICFKIKYHQLIVFFQSALIGECQSLLLGGPRVNVKVKLSAEKRQTEESYEEVTGRAQGKCKSKTFGRKKAD